MSVTFNTNLSALTSQRYLGIASDKTASSLTKLSSGSRVPTAKDDAAALAVGSKLRAEVTALNQAANNASQAISLLQIADGALSTVGDLLQRMKALATQSSSGQLGNSERALLNQEFGNLRTEVDRIANVTNFNGTTLLNGATNTILADVNNLTSTGTANTAANLVGQGVQSINFNAGFSRGGVKLEFDAAENMLRMTNLVSGQTEAVNIGNDAIASGATQTVNFSTLGATVTLNSSFDKSRSSTVTNGYRSMTTNTITMGGGGTGSVNSATISEFRIRSGSNITTADFSGRTITIASSGTPTAGTVTIDDVGGVASNDFSIVNSGTVDLSTTGSKTVTLANAAGDQVDVTFNVNTAFVGTRNATTSVNVTGLNTSRADLDIADLNYTGGTFGNGGVGTTPAVTWSIQSTNFVTANAPRVADFNGSSMSLTPVAGGAANTTGATLGSITLNGVAFTTADTFINLGLATGNQDFTFTDGSGNSFVLRGNVTTLTDDNAITNTAALTFSLDAGISTPAVQDTSVRLLGINRGSTSTFDFGTLDDATITAYSSTSLSDTSVDAANNADLVLTVNGTNFRATGVNLSTAGLKTVVLQRLDSAGSAVTGTSADSITVQFSLSQGLTANDSLSFEVAELGQFVAANSVTGTSTNFSFKVGTGVTSNDSITVSLNAATTSTLAISGSTVDTAQNADTAISLLNSAINSISSNRASIGAAQSRLDFAANSISVAIENFTAATSALMDVDVSAEITEFTSQQVLMQAGISLLAQANQQPSLLLRLLQ